MTTPGLNSYYGEALTKMKCPECKRFVPVSKTVIRDGEWLCRKCRDSGNSSDSGNGDSETASLPPVTDSDLHFAPERKQR